MKSSKLSAVFLRAKFFLFILSLNIWSAANVSAAEMVDLGDLGGTYSEPTGISADGSVIVGWSTRVGGANAANRSYAFSYSNGVMTELDFGGTSNAYAADISRDGTIIVGSLGNNPVQYSAGVVVDLGAVPRQVSATAHAISGDGNVIVGGGTTNAFKYTGGMISSIGNLGAGSSVARGASYDGSVIVGYSATAGGSYHAFKYTGTTMVDMGTFAGVGTSRAYGVSDDGSVIVGHSTIAGGVNYHAFKYTGTTMTDIGNSLGGINSIAYGVSADGAIIVGRADIAGNAAHHAFKYQNNRMVDLGTLGGSDSSAFGISADNKVIIGISDIAGDAEQHAFMVRAESILPVDINNTAAAIASGARQLNSIINLTENNLNFALSQDATLFGENNLNVTVGTRYTKVDPYTTSQVAATLKVAYRFNEHVRAGIFLDQAASNSMPDNYALKSAKPIAGVFTTLTQRGDNTGAQLRLAAAYNSSDLSITRNTLAFTEAGNGTSSLTSKGALAEASYGFKLTESLNLRPLVGVRFTKVTRDSYTENSGADFPISYKNMEKKSTAGLAGLQLSSIITTKLSLQTRLMVEHDLQRSIDGYEGDVSYLGSFNIAAPHLKRNRGVASVGGGYKIDETQEVGFGVIYSQHSLNGGDVITSYVNYAMGF